MSKFSIKLKRRNIPEPEILADIKKIADEKGLATLTALQYSDHGQFGVNTILRKFKSWNNALIAAGLEAPNHQNVEEEELFKNLAELWQKLGRQPVGKDVDKSTGTSRFSLGTYERRFSSWNNALQSFGKYINDGLLEPTEQSVRTKSTTATKRTNRKINWRIRAQILIRDNCICQMCGASPAKDPSVLLHVDHIKPWSKGGETVIENLRTLCAICNVGKSDIE